MTLPKKPKGEPPSPKCVLCRESPRPVGEFWCPPCAAHQARAAKVVRRVLAGRRVDGLSRTELLGVAYSDCTKGR